MVDLVKLDQMLREGKRPKDCARFFGVSEGRISQLRKHTKASVVKSVALENAHRVVSRNLDAVDQLRKINDKANELLDQAIEAKDHGTAIRAMSEIRQQLGLQLEILARLNDIKAVQEFQSSVLEAIGEASPEVRNAVIDKLHARNALRKSLELSR